MRTRYVAHTLVVLVIAVLAVACRREEAATPTIEATTAVAAATAAPATVPAPTTEAAAMSDEIDWPPMVLASEPAAGEEIGLGAPIVLRFDQPMDQASVEEALTIEPALAGELSWPEPSTALFTPSETIEAGQAYNLRVAGAVSAVNGQALLAPFELTLLAASPIQVTQTLPADGSNNVQTDAVIVVVFDTPIVPLVSSGEQAGLPQPLTFNPPVSGTGEWTSTSIYRFIPDPPLAGATNYVVNIDPELTSFLGSPLQSAPNWQFSTVRPEVVTVFPENDASLIIPTENITVTFNMPMDRASTEAAITLSGNENAAISIGYEWADGDRIVVLDPEANLPLETRVTLTVNSSASAANGLAGMARDHTSRFDTVPFPAVLSTYPSNGSVTDTWQRGFSVEFASPMNDDTIIEQFIIEPDPGDVEYYINEWEGNYAVYVEFELTPNLEYTVTIPASAADPYGNTLEEDYVFAFFGAPTPPLASFNLPMNVAQLSTSFPTNVQVMHRSVSELTVSLYDAGQAVDLLLNPYMLMENPPTGDPLFQTTIPVTFDDVNLGVTTVQLADGGTLPTGLYRLRVSAPETSLEESWWQIRDTFLIVADTNLVVKEMFDEVHVWATELASGQPAAGRTLTLFQRNGTQVGTAQTDANGFARFDYKTPESYLEGVLVFSNEPGQTGYGVASSNWTAGLLWEMGINQDTGREQELFAYVYTDRPIYRPGDTVYYKGIVRETNYGRYNLPTVEELSINVGPNFYLDETNPYSEEFTVTLDEDGVFYGELKLPNEMSLGDYAFSFTGRDMWLSTRTFTVAEYRAPEFEVLLTPSTPEALRGEGVEATVLARYLFGGSAAGLKVNWTLNDVPFDPSFDTTPGYVYGDSAYFFYDEDQSPFNFGGGNNYLGDGSGETDGNGQIVIPLTPDLHNESDQGSREVTVEATVGGLGEFPVSGRTTIRFHAAETYVGLRSSNRIVNAGSEATVDLATVDWDGNPVGNQAVEVVVYQREWERERVAQYGMRFTNWIPVDTEVARQSAITDNDGKASVSFIPESGGTYLAVATVTDGTGRQQVSSISIWSIDEDYFGWRTDPNVRTMELTTDKQEYRAGETARILVQSPFAQPTVAWLTVERGTIIDQQLVTLDGSTTVDLPMTADYAPNVFITITAIKPVNPDDADYPYADIRIGYLELRVPPDQFDLAVNLTPGQESYAPGDTATFDIAVTDQAGSPVQSEVSLALVDLAVLLLKEDNAPHILEAFYTIQPLRSNTGSGLFTTGEGREIEEPLFGGGLGGGGGDMEAAASFRLPDEEGVRGDFRDTAYWEAKVMTDSSGRATVEIPLPDNVTTWRLHSKAATTDTRVGQASVDILARLPLIIRPVTPRFFTVGDNLKIGANVNNNTDAAIEATTSLEALGITINSDTAQTVTIPANGRTLVQWDVTVEDYTAADLTFRVEGGGYRDASKPTMGEGPEALLPIYRFDGRDFVATAGELDEGGRRVEGVILPVGVDTRQGNVTVRMQPSLAAAVIESFDVLDTTFVTALECPGWLSDRLLHNLAIERAISELDLEMATLMTDLSLRNTADVAKLAELQRGDGSWAWCYGDTSDTWVTAQSLLVLTQAEELGYEIDRQVMNQASEYLEQQLTRIDRIGDASAANRQAFFIYVLAEADLDIVEDADAMFEEHRALMDPYAKALLAMAYEGNGGGDNQTALLTDLSDSAIISATGAHWEDAEQDFFNLSSTIRGTAMVIDALSRLQPDSPLLPPAVRWIMVARTAETWPTLHQSAWSVNALTSWMAVSGELEADYGYLLRVNMRPGVSGQFTPEDVTESEVVDVPVSELLTEEVNFFDFQRGQGPGRLYYTLRLDSAIIVDQLDPVNRGFTVERRYFDAACNPETEDCQPIDTIIAGQNIRVELTVTLANDRIYVLVEDPIPSGTDAIDPNLLTSQGGAGGSIIPDRDEFGYGYWGWWYFDSIQYRDEKVVFLSQYLPAGTYQYTYFLQTNIPGSYQVMPATAREEYFPEVFGRSDGSIFTITE